MGILKSPKSPKSIQANPQVFFSSLTKNLHKTHRKMMYINRNSSPRFLLVLVLAFAVGICPAAAGKPKEKMQVVLKSGPTKKRARGVITKVEPETKRGNGRRSKYKCYVTWTSRTGDISTGIHGDKEITKLRERRRVLHRLLQATNAAPGRRL